MYQKYAKDESRVHQFGTQVVPGIFMGYALEREGGSLTGDLFTVDKEDLEHKKHHQKNSRKKVQLKRGGHFFNRDNEFVFHAQRPKYFKKDSRYPQLCTKRRASSGKDCKKNLSKKKDKPQIQVQILKFDKISGVVRDIAYIGIMLLQG